MNAISGYDFVKTIISRNKNYPVEELLEHAGNTECDYLEFKATVEVRPDECKNNECPTDIYWNIAKELIAMINSRGGILIIGVTDDPSHAVVPLEGRDSHDYFIRDGKESYYRRAIEGHVVPASRTWKYKTCEFHTEKNIANYLERTELTYRGHTLFSYLVKPCAQGDFISVIRTHLDPNGQRLSGPEELYRRLSGHIGECECLTTYVKFQEHLKSRKIEDEELSSELNRLNQTEHFTLLSTLPPRNMDFVGREEDLNALSALIDQGRIPVLHGEGGIGKTELACEFAYRNQSKFGGGCLFLDMTGILHYDQVAEAIYAHMAIKDTLGPIPTDVTNQTDWIFAKLLDRVKRGSMLVILDNLENAKALTFNELKNGPLAAYLDGNRRVCLIATTREADGKIFPENGVERAKVVELNALKPDAAAMLLCSRLPKDICMNDTDRKAVADIVALLGHHAWRTEITGGYLSQNLEDYGNPPFVSYLRELKERGWILPAESDTYRQNGLTTEDLLKPTIKKLKDRGTEGREAIALAECISKFPSAGVTEGPLVYFWKRHIANAKEDHGVRKILNLLAKYALIGTHKPGERIKMHQLTRDYFRARKQTSPDKVSKCLADDPNCPIRYWAELARENVLMKYCPWDRLPGSANRDIVLSNPVAFASKIRWNVLDGYALSDILSADPTLAKYVKSYDVLYDDDPESSCMAFAMLLAVQPERFAKHCEFSRLKCRDVVYLLTRQPHLLEQCLPTIKSFTSHEWSAILSRQPSILMDSPLSDLCPWDAFETGDWARLIAHQPRFKDDPHFLKRHSLRDLSPFSWAQLIIRNGEDFLRHPDCPREEMAADPDAIVALLSSAPWILSQRNEDDQPLVNLNLKRISAAGWVHVLTQQPQLQDLCSRCRAWGSFTGKEWSDLLSECPQFLDKCDTSKLNGNDWAKILDKHPELESPAAWESMATTPHDEFLSPLVRVFYNHPELADSPRHIDFESFSTTGKRLLLSHIPSLHAKINVRELPSHEWARLIMADPSPANVSDRPLKDINDIEKAVVAVLHPQLDEYLGEAGMLTRNLRRDRNRVQAIYDLFWDLDEARMTCNAAKVISAAVALSWIYFSHGLYTQAQRYAVMVRQCWRKYGDPPNRKPLNAKIGIIPLLRSVSTMVNPNDNRDVAPTDRPVTIFIMRFDKSKTGVASKIIPGMRKILRKNHSGDIIDNYSPNDKKSERTLVAAKGKGKVVLIIFQEGLPDYLPEGKLKEALKAFHKMQSPFSDDDKLKKIGFDRLITVPPMLMAEIPDTYGKAVLNAALYQSQHNANPRR